MAAAPPSPRRRGPTPHAGTLWRHADFRRLWGADTASQLGVALGSLAIPYLAVTVLHATQFEMGLLTTLQMLGFLVVGLPAGALIDRRSKRRVMMTADVGRALLLGTVVAASAFGVLTLAQVMVVATAVGVLTVFFDVSYQSYLPLLVDRDQVVEGNAKLQATQSVSQLAGPAVGGLLLTRLGAATVIGINGVGYLASAVGLWRIRHREEPPPPRTAGESLRTEIAEGLRFIVGHRLLRRLIACTGLSNLFSMGTGALVVLYMVRDLHLSAFVIGVVDSVAAVGGLAGAAVAGRLARRLGEGGSILATAVAFVALGFCTPLASVLPPVPVLVVGGLGMSAAVVAYNIATVSFRQRLCPPRLLGRMNASARFLVWGTGPIGAFLAGALSTGIGVPATLWVFAAGSALCLVPVASPTVWRLRRLPSHDDGDAPDPAPADPSSPSGAPTTATDLGTGSGATEPAEVHPPLRQDAISPATADRGTVQP
ncbi:MFS transporter [Nakamurella endophytica]|uniref:MFS transporter n=1 Tax=Nakamurella endophytica TaxID=1748367 RepID=UPI001E3A7E12|nr:MFS transporter [Nakamurella endophytica]